MGDDVGDNDGTSRTPLISLPCTTLPYPALPCLALLCLSFKPQFREKMHNKSFEPSQRAMRRDQPKTPGPMRGTLPNTDQPRIPHSEYYHRNTSSLSENKWWRIVRRWYSGDCARRERDIREKGGRFGRCRCVRELW